MTRSLSPIHSPLDPEVVESTKAPLSRVARLTALDQYVLSNRVHSLGPGGASSAFSRAIDRALVDEIVEQLREGPFDIEEDSSGVRRWAAEIIAAFGE